MYHTGKFKISSTPLVEKKSKKKNYNTLSISIIDCIYAPLDTLREHSVQLRKFLQVLNRKTIRSPLMPLSLNHADMQ